MTALLRTLAGGVIGAAGLHVFYRGVRHQWPENYSTLRATLEAPVSGGLGRYVLFRMGPVYLAGVFVAVTLHRLHVEPSLALTILAGGHALSTNGVAVWKLLRPGSPEPRVASLLVYYVAATLAVFAATAAAGWSYRAWDALIPGPHDIVVALWTGLLAAVLAAYLQSLRLKAADTTELLPRARKDVGPRLLAYAEQAATPHDCDPDFIVAVVLAEALQRPRWMRRLENAKGKLVGAGSYGVAQAPSQHPVSDEESIDLLAAQFAGYYPERSTSYGSVLTERLAAQVEQHNRKAAFVQMVCDIYFELQPYTKASSAARARDGRPMIEVSTARRSGWTWQLAGTAAVFEATLHYVADGNDAWRDQGSCTVSAAGPARGRWRLDLPLAARRVWLSQEAMEETEDDAERQAFLDLDML